jgi:hypothetical protein
VSWKRRRSCRRLRFRRLRHRYVITGGSLLPVVGICRFDASPLHAALEQVDQHLKPTLQQSLRHNNNTHLIVRLVRVLQTLDVIEELLQIGRQMFEQQPVIVLLLHQSHLFLVLDLAPRQLSVDELHQHVEQAPEVVVTSHLYQHTLSIDGDSNNGPTHLCFCAR